MTSASARKLDWLTVVPFAALLFYAASVASRGRGFDLTLVPILLSAVFASVHHAEVIAHRLGEPYGALVLTMAVTIIEVALIVSVRLGGEGARRGARGRRADVQADLQTA